MRKIISILLTLGVILGLTAFAAPVAAQPCVCPATMSSFDILTPPFCAGATQTYTLGTVTPITLPISLVVGTDMLSVDFPADTDLSTVTAAGVSVISTWGGGPFSPATITVSGQHLEFRVPVGFLVAGPVMPAGDTISITVVSVTNPTVDDTYCLYIDYMESCGGGGCVSTQFACQTYAVVPATNTLDFRFDFSPNYPGLALDFIPPFKACGQPLYGSPHAVGFVTNFNLIIDDVVPGCAPACPAAKLFFVLTKCPAGETITYNDGVNIPDWTLTAADIGDVLDPTTHKIINPAIALPTPWADIWLAQYIHFSSPGKYEICFYLECPAVTCGPGKQIVADECMPAAVYQWKEAVKIPLYAKWNLISLPLVPLVDPPIADILDAYLHKAQIMSVWYYDRCENYPTGQWYVHPTPTGTQKALTTMEDGKSYWVRIAYNTTSPAGTPLDGLWTWGTPKPTPTSGPSSYAVCEGWNMIGLTGYETGVWGWGVPTTDDAYLWNWIGPVGQPLYSGIYGWDPIPQTWYSLTPPYFWPLPWLYTGEGYWTSFAHDGFIYPP